MLRERVRRRRIEVLRSSLKKSCHLTGWVEDSRWTKDIEEELPKRKEKSQEERVSGKLRTESISRTE